MAARKAKPKPADDDSLAADVEAFIRRFVVMEDAQYRVVALWVIHTYCIELVEQTPYLSVTSPEKQCGKTRLLEALQVLVARPWKAVLPSEAVLFRNIDLNAPTLLLDEIDTIFNPRTADRYEGHRALLNAGHRRGDKVPRCVGTSQEIVEFDPFCAKALAGIGVLPDTVADRSIPIRLFRKTRAETVERFKTRDAEPIAKKLRDRCQAWGLTKDAKRAARARPKMPDELSDRMQEGCEVLVAMADRLGCGTETRAALVELLSGERLDEQETMRIRLLTDIRGVFEELDREREREVRAISTAQLISRLAKIEEGPWAKYYGRQLEPRDLASLLRQYEITSTTVRLKGGPKKGYKRDAFHDAWTRYLP